jgi:hypothetical protein
MRIALTVPVLLAAARTAAADCPTRTDELPATGIIASATRMAMEEVGVPQADVPTSGMSAQVSAAGGMRADNTDVASTASVAGMVSAHSKSGFAGCASADLVDVADGAAHATASAQVPFLFTGLAFGLSFDRHVELPLAARGDYLRAPLSRISWTIGISFIDFAMTDEQGNHLRTQIMPFTVEQGLASQDDQTTVLDRRTTQLETAMFRFIASDKSGSGTMDVFAFGMDTVEPADAPPGESMETAGFIRMSPLSITSERETWDFELDGGWLGLAGPADCQTTRCYRGFYTGMLGYRWQNISVEGRAERTGFTTPTDLPAFEDRLTATASLEGKVRKLSGSVYGARVASWEGDEVVLRAGLRASLAQELSHGFSGVIDGEIARANAPTLPSSPVLAPTRDSRVLVSLAWHKATAD